MCDSSKLSEVLAKALQSNDCDASTIEQIPADRTVDYESLSADEKKEYFDLGLESISRGEVAALVLAGGQASRLGAHVPKGAFDLSIGFGKTDSLFYLQAARLCRLVELARQKFSDRQPVIPWLIMTSNSTHEETQKHIEQVIDITGFPQKDVLIFSQNEIPTIDLNGNVLLKSKGVIATNPDGNGGVYHALRPFLSSLESQGVKFFHTFSVDNILCKVCDPCFIGACKAKNADCAAKTVEKIDPKESVGTLCLKNGRVCVVEYSEITPELAERRNPSGKLFLNAGNIANHVFTLSFLKKICGSDESSVIKLPFHIAKKKVAYADVTTGELVQPSVPNAYKMELFIFDSFHYAENFLLYQVAAATQFSPLKNANSIGRDCLDTCIRDLSANHLKWIKDANISISLDEVELQQFKIFISPIISYEGEGLNEQSVIQLIEKQIKDGIQCYKSGPKHIVINA